MRLVLTLLLLLATVAVVGYTHWQLVRQVRPLLQRALGHGLVVLVAAAFAWTVSATYMGAEEGGGLAAFLMAFGVAHMPPAIVLFLKQQEKQ
ncbi:hypothetical protein [Marinobacter zhanjiangensis]|uniref:Uncharacterized protein n=1 Tax=Marinobacter zhanjiangensis TaxID=578215 RepID=A0ABQ3B282_9GAMM|nr:hypothetical protein [Marinobacter zhanjiangensis]GGY75107.1 hypothetical protein GCM10007071_22890 [Marinobacter zhanjiangensis]